ncbi:MAG TPA: hypothetical protein VJ790_16210 [Dongiaceae bacterium]|nr:hypothetical protein [Dongiaceae bacterium]
MAKVAESAVAATAAKSRAALMDGIIGFLRLECFGRFSAVCESFITEQH